jgi:hypothetical protein
VCECIISTPQHITLQVQDRHFHLVRIHALILSLSIRRDSGGLFPLALIELLLLLMMMMREIAVSMVIVQVVVGSGQR